MRFYQSVPAVALCAGALWITGCGDSRNRTALTNDELDGSVSAKLHEDAQLSPYNLDVSADASKNAVTLSGNVPSETLRLRAVDLAKQAHAGLVVTDKIDVKPEVDRSVERSREVERSAYTEEMARDSRERAKTSGEKIGNGLDDAWIHTKIRTKLAGNGQFPLGGINVDVEDKVVTLRGTVDSAKEKAEAERIARETNGVATVQNKLVVKKG
jgi:osmotically-inducible protein OsmY